MTQSFFQQASVSLGGIFSRLRDRLNATIAGRTWSIGGARANPELHDFNGSNTLFGPLLTAVHRWRMQRRWERDLRALDDRQLRDIGITRANAEHTLKRIRFWI